MKRVSLTEWELELISVALVIASNEWRKDARETNSGTREEIANETWELYEKIEAKRNKVTN